MDVLIEFEQVIRPAVFLALLVLLAAAEFFFPLAKRKCTRAYQWGINLGMVLLDSLILKLIFPLLAVGVAHYAAEQGLGLFNLVALPVAVTLLLSLLMLDLLIYGQHVLMHNLPLLWRLHRVHHTELGLDVTSAVRFHPIEIVISMVIKMIFVLLMGIPVAAVIIFEILLNALALFNHSNIKLPKAVDAILRKLIVTPEVHWIHHSEKVRETNSNYGFNLIIWDKLFSTYIAKPQVDYPKMQQGLRQFGLQKPLSLYQLLILPFRGKDN
ncbi:sterol desaturase family protein [Psychromonas sp.]|uniref:sterol desaturase family protein n=1 Tax=Psychromonas sp. TaxID=1884585 RepID=UPI003568AA7C